VLDRSQFIGGSDAAAVVGMSRWSTPLHVWAEKTGQIETHQLDSEAAELGTYLEEYVARRFTKETGKKVHRVNETRFHPKYPFLGANIDRRVVGEEAILECKTTSAWKAKEWDGEEIPHEYIIQVTHYLAVTGAKKAYIAVLIGNQDFKWKTIERDEKLIQNIISREVEFWNKFVVPKVMPTTVSKNDSDTLYQLFPVASPESTVDLGDEGARLIESRNALYQDAITLEGHIAEVENSLKAMIKDNESGMAGKWKVYWQNQSQTRLDTKRIKLEIPEIYSKYGTVSKFRKLVVREESTNGKR